MGFSHTIQFPNNEDILFATTGSRNLMFFDPKSNTLEQDNEYSLADTDLFSVVSNNFIINNQIFLVG